MVQYIHNPECLSVAEESYQGLLAHFSSFEILFITTALFLFIMIGGLLGVENKDRLFTKNSLSTGMKSIRILIDWIEGMTIIALFEGLINIVLLLFFYQNPYHLYTVMFIIIHIVLFNCKKQES